MSLSLPSLGLSLTETTLSGMSSGGYMAVQMHTIYSSLFKGLGVYAGGPYGCGLCGFGADQCITNAEKVKFDTMINLMMKKAGDKMIDDLANIEG